MKRRQHRQQAARRPAPAGAPRPAAQASVESLSAAGEEDPGAAVDTLVSPGAPVPGAGQMAVQTAGQKAEQGPEQGAPPPPDEAPPHG